MKKVLWIACLLCLMPFLGYAQTNASLAMQDDEEIFGQAPVSKELPAKIQLNVSKGGTRDASPEVWAHAMFIPSQGYTFGRYYVVYTDGTVEQVVMYNDWYYSSAEYYSGEVITEGYPVWAYAEDYEIGFMCLGYEDGGFMQNQTNPISLSMNDITYDYHNSRMLGVKYGRIYEVNISAEGDLGDIVRDADGNDYLFAYDEKDEDGNSLYLLEDGSYPIRPIAIACDLDGTVYIVTTSADGTATSYLYKFEKEDVSLDNPIPLGALNWPARGIQTMAFNHNTRQLYWFACDKDGNSQLKELDKTSGAIIWEGEMLNTEIGGLIFEFDYVPHTAYCIDEDGIELTDGSLLLDPDAEDENDVYTLTHSGYLPGKDVVFKVTYPDCMSLDSIVIFERTDFTVDDDRIILDADGNPVNVIDVIHLDDLVMADDTTASFVMPAVDVNILAFWTGNEHNVTLNWSPKPLRVNNGGTMETVIPLTMDGTIGGCGETVTVTYARPNGYFLKSITVTDADGNEIDYSVDANNSQITFVMPDSDVTVYALYKKFNFHQLEDICKYETLRNLPIEQHTVQMHEHIFYFTPIVEGVPGTTVQFGPTGQYGSGACHQIDEEMSHYVFTIAGTWNYMSEFIDRKFGPFYTETLSFQVYEAPQSIAIEGNQYNCEGGSIELTAVAMLDSVVDTEATLNGTFVWKKNDVEVATTTTPTWTKDDIVKADAGIYTVTFYNNINPESTVEQDTICDFTSPGYPVNVSSIPNKPDIRFYEGENPICFGSSVAIEWDHGVLNPDEYEFQWSVWDTIKDASGNPVLDDSGSPVIDWVEIPDGNSNVLETGELEVATTFMLSLHYAGENSLCHSDSDPFVVNVKPETRLIILGDDSTCETKNPDNNPIVEGDFTGFEWTFNNTVLDETSNELHFENYDLVNTPGTYKIKVSAIDNSDANHCVVEGEMDFTVIAAPDVTIENDVDPDEIAYYDHEVDLYVCMGSHVTLTAGGADTYLWDPTTETTDVIEVLATEDKTYTVLGTESATGCQNTATIHIHVNALPEITWVNPDPDDEDRWNEEGEYEFSMMETNIELAVNVEGVGTNIPLGTDPGQGIFAYIVDGDPTSHPIEDAEGNPINIFNPSQLGLGHFMLVYSYTDANGCQAENRIDIRINKPYWTDIDKWDPNWYDDCVSDGNRHFEITNPAQMGSFMAYVYGLNGVDKYDFAGDTIWITAHINMLEKPYFYRPFCDSAVFNGVIDGNAKFITNMTILEENLDMRVNGFIRNFMLKDAHITSIGNPCTIYMTAGSMLHNGMVSMPELNNVTIDLDTNEEVQNCYYYGPNKWTAAGGNVCIYINTEGTPIFFPVGTPDYFPSTSNALLTMIRHEYAGILEDWVWYMNDYNYIYWITDEAGNKNYGYPYLFQHFVHHHYVEVMDAGCGTDDVTTTGILTRTINEVDYEYAMNGDAVTVEFTPASDYMIYDSLVCTAIDYNGVKDSVFKAEKTGDYTFAFTMPIDSIYLPAYRLEIQPYARKSYWTDEENIDIIDIDTEEVSYHGTEWYYDCSTDGRRFEITSPEDLAAFAWEVNYGGHDFAGDTVHITGSGTPNSLLLDMSGHYWQPINGFKGVLNGTRYIVDNLYIDENCGDEGYNAMFVNCSGSIINMGLQDIVLPEENLDPAEGETASYIAAYVLNPDNDNASVINSFVTWDWTTRPVHYEIAVGESVTVTNSYTLDEGGNMVDHQDQPINITGLKAWVAENSLITPYVWWDWTDEAGQTRINYYRPIHSGLVEPGYTITYVPSGSTPDEGGNFVGGPTTGKKGTTITVTVHLEECYDLTSLLVLNPDGTTYKEFTITNTSATQFQFTMPDHAVTVTATFAPKNWTLTVNYLFVNEDGETEVLTDPVVEPNKHMGDVINLQDYIDMKDKVITDYEPIEMTEDEMTDEMPCNNKTIDIYYQGKEHNIITDQCEDLGYDVTITTDPEGTARYRTTVTVTVTVEEGVSIAGLDITDANGNDIEETFTGTMWVYTFEMPNSDVTICAIPTEEYWDDYLIADPTWFFDDPYATSYVIETDSMLGGLAALVTGRQWLLEHWTEYTTENTPEGYDLDEETLAALTFEGVTITLNSTQEENELNLIEHKWRPIGAQIEFNKQFQGTFNGNGHKITNMNTVDATHYNEQYNGACQALFGTVGVNAIINDVNIQGRAEGRYFTAGVAAVNYGLIMNCVADVNVYSEFQAGGIVCNNYATGYILNSYCISDQVECFSADNSKDQDNPTNAYYVGGVASYNEGIVNNCHSVATLVKGNGHNPIHYYGNIIGMNAGQVDNCYWLEDSEFAGYGEKMGSSWSFDGCGFIGTTTSADMTAMAQTLTDQLEDVTTFPFFAWEDGEDGYPVFVITSKAIMSLNGEELNVVLYPNPTKDVVNIYSDNIQRVTVFNMFGQMVLDTQVNGNETTINMNGFSAGVYMVRITTAMGVATRNVVVE